MGKHLPFRFVSDGRGRDELRSHGVDLHTGHVGDAELPGFADGAVPQPPESDLIHGRRDRTDRLLIAGQIGPLYPEAPKCGAVRNQKGNFLRGMVDVGQQMQPLHEGMNQVCHIHGPIHRHQKALSLGLVRQSLHPPHGGGEAQVRIGERPGQGHVKLTGPGFCIPELFRTEHVGLVVETAQAIPFHGDEHL